MEKVVIKEIMEGGKKTHVQNRVETSKSQWRSLRLSKGNTYLNTSWWNFWILNRKKSLQLWASKNKLFMKEREPGWHQTSLTATLNTKWQHSNIYRVLKEFHLCMRAKERQFRTCKVPRSILLINLFWKTISREGVPLK